MRKKKEKCGERNFFSFSFEEERGNYIIGKKLGEVKKMSVEEKRFRSPLFTCTHENITRELL